MNAPHVARSQIFLICGHVGRLLLFVGVTSVLGRGLAPADFGFVALVASIFVVAQELLDMGTTATATRQIARQPATERATLAALLAWRRLFAMVLCAAMLGLAASGRVAQGDEALVLVAVAMALFILHQGAYYVVFQVRQAYGWAVTLALSTQTGFVLASAVALKLQAGGAAIGALLVARELAQVVGSRFVAIRMLGHRLRARWLDPAVGGLLRAAWMIGIAGVCYKLVAYAGGFFLWGTGSPESLASFSAAQRLLIPISDATWLFVTPLLASMSMAAAHADAVFRAQLEGYAKLLLCMSAIVAVAGYFIAADILALFYGDRYTSGPWSAISVLHWLSLGYLFALVTPVMAMAAVARGHTRALLIGSSATLGVTLMGNMLVVPRLGADGAAIVRCAGEALVFAFLFTFWVARGELRLDRGWIAYLAPAALLAALLLAWPDASRWKLPVACAWALAAAVIVLRLPAQRACRASLAALIARAPALAVSPGDSR